MCQAFSFSPSLGIALAHPSGALKLKSSRANAEMNKQLISAWNNSSLSSMHRHLTLLVANSAEFIDQLLRSLHHPKSILFFLFLVSIIDWRLLGWKLCSRKTNGVGDDIKINDHCKTYSKFCVLYRFVTVCGWQGEIISKNPKLIGCSSWKRIPQCEKSFGYLLCSPRKQTSPSACITVACQIIECYDVLCMFLLSFPSAIQ